MRRSNALQVILYLSYFYKHSELTIRLAFFWLAMTLADIIAALAAAGLLQMRGVLGLAGWRWMFLIEVCAPTPKIVDSGPYTYGIAGPLYTHYWARFIYPYASKSDANCWNGPRKEGLV